MKELKNRALVSFDGRCPYNCKHCYTYELEQTNGVRTIDEIVESIADQDFDVIYVSQKRENFVVPEEGLELCERLYQRYKCDIVAITRSVFDNLQLERLATLHRAMSLNGHWLFVAVSVPALQSAGLTEDLACIPSPFERISFIKRMYDKGLNSILVVRPLYPNQVIPIEEILQIITLCEKKVSCVLSSGLITNAPILRRLNVPDDLFEYRNDGVSDYLVGTIESDCKFIDVRKEIKTIANECAKQKLPFFEHSMPALNHLKNEKRPLVIS